MMGNGDPVQVTMSRAVWYLLTEAVDSLVQCDRAPTVRFTATVHGTELDLTGTVLVVSVHPTGAAEITVAVGDDGEAVTIPAAAIIGVDWP
jgi:hypothetical protein